jgi:hypothetical protein
LACVLCLSNEWSCRRIWWSQRYMHLLVFLYAYHGGVIIPILTINHDLWLYCPGVEYELLLYECTQSFHNVIWYRNDWGGVINFGRNLLCYNPGNNSQELIL